MTSAIHRHVYTPIGDARANPIKCPRISARLRTVLHSGTAAAPFGCHGSALGWPSSWMLSGDQQRISGDRLLCTWAQEPGAAGAAALGHGSGAARAHRFCAALRRTYNNTSTDAIQRNVTRRLCLRHCRSFLRLLRGPPELAEALEALEAARGGRAAPAGEVVEVVEVVEAVEEHSPLEEGQRVKSSGSLGGTVY